jgi:hypothetical protein
MCSVGPTLSFVWHKLFPTHNIFGILNLSDWGVVKTFWKANRFLVKSVWVADLDVCSGIKSGFEPDTCVALRRGEGFDYSAWTVVCSCPLSPLSPLSVCLQAKRIGLLEYRQRCATRHDQQGSRLSYSALNAVKNPHIILTFYSIVVNICTTGFNNKIYVLFFLTQCINEFRMFFAINGGVFFSPQNSIKKLVFVMDK